MELSHVVARRVTEIVVSQAEVEPVLALHGPRSVGKSTVLQMCASRFGVDIVDLDDVEVREAVEGNVTAAVAQGRPLCVDEYQRLPLILDGIKARLNQEGSLPGAAILTGSTRQDALPRSAQALTGRLHSMVIWPLSQGEIAGVREDLLAQLLTDAQAAVNAIPFSPTERGDYVDRVCAGGMPLALRRSGPARARWFDDFIRTSIERDAVELTRIRERQALADLIAYLAAHTGQILNVSAAAEQLGISRITADSHLRLLEDLFLAVRLPAWGKTLRSRVTARPKIHVVDSGLAARLLRLTPEKLVGIDPTSLTEFGHLLETFVVGELRKQASWLEEPPLLGHWRTSDGAEVDLIVERDDGRVLAVEVKASERASGGDFRGLAQLRDLLGDRFLGGVMLTTGRRSYTYDDRLNVMPIDRLWTPIQDSPLSA